MRFRRTKSEADRLVETIGGSFAALSGSVTNSRLLKAGLIAGGLAALTAGSAAISLIRRQMEEGES